MAALPERAFNALQRAKGHLAAQQPQQAVAELDKVLRKAPNAAEAWALLQRARDGLAAQPAAAGS